MLNRDALEYLVELGETEVLEIEGYQYTSNKLYRVEQPRAAALGATTLTSLVDYIKSKIDEKHGQLLIHVESPSKVSLKSELNDDRARETYLVCEALTPNNIHFDRFIDTEHFNIMLQSSFVENQDRALLLKVTGCIRDNAVKEIGDDGVSQAATIKTGVASVNDVKVPNPVILAPYRTFPEIEQPESKFVFRMRTGPQAAIYEADGGAWRNEAMSRIKAYLEKELEGLENIEIIS